jgi:hypothetical protein
LNYLAACFRIVACFVEAGCFFGESNGLIVLVQTLWRYLDVFGFELVENVCDGAVGFLEKRG